MNDAQFEPLHAADMIDISPLNNPTFTFNSNPLIPTIYSDFV